jgi:hypothetical protein
MRDEIESRRIQLLVNQAPNYNWSVTEHAEKVLGPDRARSIYEEYKNFASHLTEVARIDDRGPLEDLAQQLGNIQRRLKQREGHIHQPDLDFLYSSIAAEFAEVPLLGKVWCAAFLAEIYSKKGLSREIPTKLIELARERSSVNQYMYVVLLGTMMSRVMVHGSQSFKALKDLQWLSPLSPDITTLEERIATAEQVMAIQAVAESLSSLIIPENLEFSMKYGMVTVGEHNTLYEPMTIEGNRTPDTSVQLGEGWRPSPPKVSQAVRIGVPDKHSTSQPNFTPLRFGVVSKVSEELTADASLERFRAFRFLTVSSFKGFDLLAPFTPETTKENSSYQVHHDSTTYYLAIDLSRRLEWLFKYHDEKVFNQKKGLSPEKQQQEREKSKWELLDSTWSLTIGTLKNPLPGTNYTVTHEGQDHQFPFTPLMRIYQEFQKLHDTWPTLEAVLLGNNWKECEERMCEILKNSVMNLILVNEVQASGGSKLVVRKSRAENGDLQKTFKEGLMRMIRPADKAEYVLTLSLDVAIREQEILPRLKPIHAVQLLRMIELAKADPDAKVTLKPELIDALAEISQHVLHHIELRFVTIKDKLGPDMSETVFEQGGTPEY